MTATACDDAHPVLDVVASSTLRPGPPVRCPRRPSSFCNCKCNRRRNPPPRSAPVDCCFSPPYQRRVLFLVVVPLPVVDELQTHSPFLPGRSRSPNSTHATSHATSHVMFSALFHPHCRRSRAMADAATPATAVSGRPRSIVPSQRGAHGATTPRGDIRRRDGGALVCSWCTPTPNPKRCCCTPHRPRCPPRPAARERATAVAVLSSSASCTS